jgi:hypothetical protein
MQRGHVPETNAQLKVVLAIDELSGERAQCMAVFFGFFNPLTILGGTCPRIRYVIVVHALEERRGAGDLELFDFLGGGARNVMF